jgi:hypothetical protein
VNKKRDYSRTEICNGRQAIINRGDDTNRITVSVHQLTRAEFDQLPGKENCTITGSSRWWHKEVNSVLSVFTDEPPVEEK